MRMPELPLTDATPLTWRVGVRTLSLERPLIMGIVNVTPDSFSDGGRYYEPSAAIAHAQRLIAEDADLLDVGGESTRPGAESVSAAEELRRVMPVIEALAGGNVPLSIDTSKPEVMRAALNAGASIVNDVAALQAPGAIEAVSESDCGVVLMHMQGNPRTMQRSPAYDDVTSEVAEFLAARIEAARSSGIDQRRIAVDPGFGFGKTVAHNYTLLRELSALQRLRCPLVVGLSRKSMLAAHDRLSASVAAAVLAVERGANIVRVHDVAATRDALKVLHEMQVNAGEQAT